MAINTFSGGNPINSLQAAGKNAVINSGMDIWQRGTSIAIAASTPSYSTDRWMLYNTANQASVVSRQVTGDTTNLPNIQYCARVQRNSGQTGIGVYNFAQSFETVNSIQFAGQTVTLSFYARAGVNFSPTSSILVASITTGTGTDQNRATAGYTGDSLESVNATLTTTWQRFTITRTLPTTTTEIATMFTWTPVGTAGANDYFEITGVQLELGTTATTFSRNGSTRQAELAACQRYYYRASAANCSGTAAMLLNGHSRNTTTDANMSLTAPVQMRTFPSILDYSTGLNLTDGASNFTVTSLTLATFSSTSNMLTVSAVSTGLTNYRPYDLTAATNNTAYVGFSAEL
jgi:hypothetical protein